MTLSSILVLSLLTISQLTEFVVGESSQESGVVGFSQQGSLRGVQHEEGSSSQLHRRLPYDFRVDFADSLGDFNTTEAGFAAGILFTILLLCCLFCMCCGGGARCSLWDCLALLCIWEICCDGRQPTDFVLV
jgi:hypothetical protein